MLTIREKDFEIKLLFEKLEFTLSTIFTENIKENGDATTEDEKEISLEIYAEGDSGIGFGASNDKEEKSIRRLYREE